MHRPVILTLCPVILVAIGVLAFAEWRGGGGFNIAPAAILPAAFVILTAAQLLPLPPPIVGFLDHQGSSLLAEGGGGTAGWRPLSLDPPRTQEALFRSVMAALVFLATYHLAAKRRGRSWFLRAVAAAGPTAVIIGLGHRIFSIPQIYGLFPNPRHLALLTGPFVNANHTAEFLELATFVNIACARQAPTQLGRIGWNAAAIICAGGAVATLSRSSVAGLGIGAVVLVAGHVLQRPSQTEQRPRRRAWLPAILGLTAVCVFAFSIGGASQILDRFHEHLPSKDGRLDLWRDSFLVLRAHPLGIGRGAFATVYPIYRTMVADMPVRFEFVENEPLQMLIEFGCLGFVLLAGAAVFPIRALIKNGRRDPMEQALLAGILAVAAHSLTDFGLETLGVLLPFSGVLGVLMGRNHRSERSASDPESTSSFPLGSRTWTYVPVTMVMFLATLGLSRLAWSAGSHDFDSEMKSARNSQEMRAAIAAARLAHPLDYYYPLVFSTLEPLIPQTGEHSPRLRALNQALSLCPNCPEVHLQIARAMWRLGRRPQALAEWTAAARRQPEIFRRSLDELQGMGAKPTELARIAQDDPQRLLDIANFLLRSGNPEQAEPVIAAAARAGVPQLEAAVLRAKMTSLGSDAPAAEAAISLAKRLGPMDSRVALLDADQTLKQATADSATQALSIVEHALDRDPDNLDLQRKRIAIVSQFERWSAAERSISGFKQALQAAGRSTVEANLAAAAIYLALGRTREAFAEYRIATSAEPSNREVWRQFAVNAEAARHYALAREAYAEVMRLAPDPKILDDLRRIDSLRADEENAGRYPAATVPLP